MMFKFPSPITLAAGAPLAGVVAAPLAAPRAGARKLNMTMENDYTLL